MQPIRISARVAVAAMNSCLGVDIDGDTRNDLVCTGGCGIVRWYENKG